MSLKNTLESLLFSSGKKISLEELSKLSKEKNITLISETLEELKKDLDDKNSSLMLIQEGDSWKLTVREKYLPFVRKIVTQTELPKSILETLAVVAFKAPVLQSAVIRIRTNKAYAHLDELGEAGYITREKKGRTKLIKLTQKFYEYFDVPEKELKQKFKSIAEKELETIKYDDAPAGKVPGIEITKPEFNRLEIYQTTPVKDENQIGDLKIYGKEKKKETKPEDGTFPEEHAERDADDVKKTDVKEEPARESKPQEEKYESKGIFKGNIPKEIEKKIDERVEEIVTGKEKSEEDSEE